MKTMSQSVIGCLFRELCGSGERHSSLSEFTYRLRVPILFLTPVSVILGAAAAAHSGSSVQPIDLILLIIGTMAGHLALYDFADFSVYRFGAVHGGEAAPLRSLIGGISPDRRTAFESLALSVFFILVSLGIFARFAVKGSPFVFVFWAGAIACFLLYRFLLNRFPFAAFILPGIGFGPVTSGMAGFVISGKNVPAVFIASMLIFFMVNGFIMLSQYDDNSSIWWRGRPFHIGRKNCHRFYSSCWILSYMTVIFGCAFQCFSDLSMMTWFTAYVALPLASEDMNFSAGTTEQLLPFEKHGIAICIAAPLVLALTLIYG